MFYPGVASKNGTLASLPVLVPVWTLTANYVLIFSADIFGEAGIPVLPGNPRPPTLTARGV